MARKGLYGKNQSKSKFICYLDFLRKAKVSILFSILCGLSFLKYVFL